MAKSRGMSLNVARSLGFVKSKPIEVDPVLVDLPCKYGNVWHQDGMSSKDRYLLARNHAKALHGEFRL